MSNSDIAEKDYNLSVSTYVEQLDTREKVDIVKLNAEIKEIVAREAVLRAEIDKIIAEIEGEAEWIKQFNFLMYQAAEEEISSKMH